jgi:gas vesicle protein
MEKQDSSTFIAGLAIGIGAGIVVGMLLAPKSGRETRDAIRKSATDSEEYFEQRGAEFRESLKSFIKSVSRQRDNLTAAIESGKEAYRQATGKNLAGDTATPPATDAPAQS